MSHPERQNLIWDDYERGSTSASADDHAGSSRWPPGAAVEDEDVEQQQQHIIRRRRSSFFETIRQAGGPNSFDAFARSLQRAADFHEITPSRPLYHVSNAADNDALDEHDYSRETIQSPGTQQSLLRQALLGEGRRVSENAIDDEHGWQETPHHELQHSVEQRLMEQRAIRDESIASADAAMSMAFAESFSTSYGSMGARLHDPSRIQGDRLRPTRAAANVPDEDKERQPLVVKRVEEGGHVVNVIVGRSTLPQTVMNSSNVLIGIGLLSLPLAFRYAGWVVGLSFFLFSALTTNYTAKLLAKCLDVDSSLVTFADLAYVAFGSRARTVTSIIFTLELIGACVALVVLFADSLEALVPALEVTSWKIVCGLLLIPLGFLPLRLLSFTSFLGILCCAAITGGVIIDGFLKPDAPGSLLQPAPTYLFPANWRTIPLSFGLMMAPWGGHSVFPNIYRDMRHPKKYAKSVNFAYGGSFVIDLALAVVGLLMFGDSVRDEVTFNIFTTPGYPKTLSYLIAVCIAIIPLTKVPLNARPLISIAELLFGLHEPLQSSNADEPVVSCSRRVWAKAAIKILTQMLFVLVAILIPSFDRIMTLLGAVACFTICIIIPLAVHLKLFGRELRPIEYWLNWVLIVLSAVMAVTSTVFALLPKEMVGANLIS